MAPVEGYVSNELLGIIGATITVAAVFLATTRGIRGDMREIRGEVRDVRTEMKNSLERAVNGLRDEIKEGDSRLHHAMNDIAGTLRDEMNESAGTLRGAIDESAGKLRDEMAAGFKEVTARLVNIGDRLSKVEGIIEGMFWSARNQPPDKPRAGAA